MKWQNQNPPHLLVLCNFTNITGFWYVLVMVTSPTPNKLLPTLTLNAKTSNLEQKQHQFVFKKTMQKLHEHPRCTSPRISRVYPLDTHNFGDVNEVHPNIQTCWLCHYIPIFIHDHCLKNIRINHI